MLVRVSWPTGLRRVRDLVRTLTDFSWPAAFTRSLRPLLIAALALAFGLGPGCGYATRVLGALTKPSVVVRKEPLTLDSLERLGTRIAETAKSLVGTAYRFGGQDPNGFDCSGLAYYVYGRFGYELPRLAKDQVKAGRWVSKGGLEPGDLVFFKGTFYKGYHVGIFLGDGRFVHAPRTGKRVEVRRLDQGYYRNKYYTARRIISDG